MESTAMSRIETNRANAALSTGPRTPEGKAVSSKNALTHGLTSAQVIIAPGEEGEFNALLESFTQDLQPQGAIESVLFNDVVHAAWQKRRIHLAEAAYVEAHPDALADPTGMAQLERYRRYHGYHHRIFRYALEKLTEIQRNRQLHAVAQAEAAKLDKTLPPASVLVKPAPKPRTRLQLQNARLETRVREVNRRLDLAPGRVASFRHAAGSLEMPAKSATENRDSSSGRTSGL